MCSRLFYLVQRKNLIFTKYTASLQDGFRTDFSSFVQFPCLATGLFWSFPDFCAYKFMLPFRETRKRLMFN